MLQPEEERELAQQRWVPIKTRRWRATSRVHATLAWDWLYEALSEAERLDYMSRLVRAIDRVLKARPTIYRENMSGYTSGFYGVKNCLWFIGCTAFGAGIEEDKVNEWLVWGRNENMNPATLGPIQNPPLAGWNTDIELVVTTGAVHRRRWGMFWGRIRGQSRTSFIHGYRVPARPSNAGFRSKPAVGGSRRSGRTARG